MKRLFCALIMSAALVHGYGPCQSIGRSQDWTGWINNYQTRAWVDARCNYPLYVLQYYAGPGRPNYPVDNATVAVLDADKGRYGDPYFIEHVVGGNNTISRTWIGCVWDGVISYANSITSHCKKACRDAWDPADDSNCTNTTIHVCAGVNETDRYWPFEGDIKIAGLGAGHFMLQKRNEVWDGNWTSWANGRFAHPLTRGVQYRANIGASGDIIPSGISRTLGSGTVVRVTAFHTDNNDTAAWPYDANYRYQQYATVFGGYSSSGEPYRIGRSRTGYDSGRFLYGKTYGDTSWRLMGHYYEDGNSSTIFNFLTDNNASILSLGFDNLVSPRVDFSDLLQPHVYDSGAGSGNLSGRVPELGGEWTVHSGSASIYSNSIRFTTNGGASIDGGQTEYSYEARITFPSTNAGPCGLMFGGAPPSDFWQLILDPGDNTTKLYEVRGALPVMRSNASLAITAGGEYRVQVTEQASSPYHLVTINGSLKNYYTTQGTPNGTRVGIFDEGVGADACRFTHVTMRPLRSKAYDSAFGRYFNQ